MTAANFGASDSERHLDAANPERLATAAFLGGHDRASTDAWARCYRRHVEDGHPHDALRCAFWLAIGLMQQGDTAQAGGWLADAGQLADGLGLDCVGCGYLMAPAALMGLSRGEFVAALDGFTAAGAVAERFDDADLRALTRLGRGQALAALGRWPEAVTLFDRAMTAVTGGEVTPVVAGIVYCAVVDQCQDAFDVRRAHEWTAALSRWCDGRPGLVAFRGQCLVHRAHVLQVHGAWGDAVVEARRARDVLSDPPHRALAMAQYQWADIHRLRGDLVTAEDGYLRAQELGRSPQPGLALVRLAQGRVDDAAAAIDGALAGATEAIERIRLLPTYVEIMVAADRLDEARTAGDDLLATAEQRGLPFLLAVAAFAGGAVLLAAGAAREALQPLRRAANAWRDLEAPYETGRTLSLIAIACETLDDHETAEHERSTARRIFEELGARPALTALDEAPPPGADTAGRRAVTAREQQVLRRVARGSTNQEIADDLFISVKAVERHLSNIFVKLDVANRTAAAAAAHERDLL